MTDKTPLDEQYDEAIALITNLRMDNNGDDVAYIRTGQLESIFYRILSVWQRREADAKAVCQTVEKIIAEALRCRIVPDFDTLLLLEERFYDKLNYPANAPFSAPFCRSMSWWYDLRKAFELDAFFTGHPSCAPGRYILPDVADLIVDLLRYGTEGTLKGNGDRCPGAPNALSQLWVKFGDDDQIRLTNNEIDFLAAAILRLIVIAHTNGEIDPRSRDYILLERTCRNIQVFRESEAFNVLVEDVLAHIESVHGAESEADFNAFIDDTNKNGEN